MTVREIIEQFEKLPKDEQDQVIAHFLGAQPMPGVSPASSKVSAEFRAIAEEVFATNNELFTKLAN